MSSEWMGTLTKSEVVALVRKRGCDVKDVNELNMVMKEMGLLICSERQWLATEKAVKYTSSNSQVDEAIWSISVVDAICDFLKE